MSNSMRTARALELLAIGLLFAPLVAAGTDETTDASATTPASAATPATPRGSAGGGELQEVIVTATRREEQLSKVPIGVTALTQDAMDVRGIKDFQDIARFTPGVSIDNSGTNAISIRGISSSAGAGTTGIYLDDTPIQMRNVGFNPEDTLPVDRREWHPLGWPASESAEFSNPQRHAEPAGQLRGRAALAVER